MGAEKQRQMRAGKDGPVTKAEDDYGDGQTSAACRSKDACGYCQPASAASARSSPSLHSFKRATLLVTIPTPPNHAAAASSIYSCSSGSPTPGLPVCAMLWSFGHARRSCAPGGASIDTSSPLWLAYLRACAHGLPGLLLLQSSPVCGSLLPSSSARPLGASQSPTRLKRLDVLASPGPACWMLCRCHARALYSGRVLSIPGMPSPGCPLVNRWACLPYAAPVMVTVCSRCVRHAR